MQRYLILILSLVYVVAALSGCAAQNLAESDAFSYACAAGGECGVYITISNPSKQEDRLVAVKTDVAPRAEMHKIVMDTQGGWTMQQVESIPVPAEDVVELKPGTLHIMLYDLNKELKAGDIFELTLQYERGGDRTVEVQVEIEN